MNGGALAALVGRGGRVHPALGLGGPQSPALQRQAPWEGPHGGQPRFRFSPKEAGRPYSPAFWRLEWRTEVRALVSGSVGLGVLSRGAFERFRVSEDPARSPALNERQHPKTRVAAGRQGESSAEVQGPQSPALQRQTPWEGPFGG